MSLLDDFQKEFKNVKNIRCCAWYVCKEFDIKSNPKKYSEEDVKNLIKVGKSKVLLDHRKKMIKYKDLVAKRIRSFKKYLSLINIPEPNALKSIEKNVAGGEYGDDNIQKTFELSVKRAKDDGDLAAKDKAARKQCLHSVECALESSLPKNLPELENKVMSKECNDAITKFREMLSPCGLTKESVQNIIEDSDTVGGTFSNGEYKVDSSKIVPKSAKSHTLAAVFIGKLEALKDLLKRWEDSIKREIANMEASLKAARSSSNIDTRVNKLPVHFQDFFNHIVFNVNVSEINKIKYSEIILEKIEKESSSKSSLELQKEIVEIKELKENIKSFKTYSDDGATPTARGKDTVSKSAQTIFDSLPKYKRDAITGPILHVSREKEPDLFNKMLEDIDKLQNEKSGRKLKTWDEIVKTVKAKYKR